MTSKEDPGLERLRVQAEAGEAYAQYELGCRYYEGRGIKRDYEEALKWYRLAAAQGHNSGLCDVGFCYRNGHGVEQDFYKARLARRHGLEVLVPEAADREEVHRVIYDELVAGVVNEHSRAAYRAVIARLVDRGAEAVILGCTEIMLLVGAIADGGATVDDTGAQLFALMLETASGAKTKSERHGYGQNEFVPWQIGAVM